MTKELRISDDLALPLDFVARTSAIIGQRGSGKTSLAAVIAEEMCREALPWVALDPVGVWWGLRALKDGSPSPFPIVVFGGEHGDLPFDKGQGRKIAEACVRANVFAVIDLFGESKTTWRTIVRDFCHALLELRPDHPRHVFLEEAPEFVPQRASHQLGAECKEIVERLVRLGRNWGYGATVLSQRPATVDKDVLSQCENLFVMRTQGAHDRKALREWTEANASDAMLEKFLDKLAGLPDGGAWFWSPQFMKKFVKIQVRDRLTFHPGDTRKVGGTARSVELADVKEFVEKVRRELTKARVTVEKPKSALHTDTDNSAPERPDPVHDKMIRQVEEATTRVGQLQSELAEERRLRQDAERRLARVRDFLKPQYESLRDLFEDLGQSGNGSAVVDRSAYDPWLAKAGRKGCRRMLEILLGRPELTRNQLGTLAGISASTGSYRTYLSWLRRNGLIETQDDMVRLRAV